jgi:hypothetical protein
MFNKEKMITLFTYPHIRDEILCMLPVAEGIIVSAIAGFLPKDIDRKRYYISAYIEDRTEISYRVREALGDRTEFIVCTTLCSLQHILQERLHTIAREKEASTTMPMNVCRLHWESKKRILDIELYACGDRYHTYVTQSGKTLVNGSTPYTHCKLSCCGGRDYPYDECKCGEQKIRVYDDVLLHLANSNRVDIIHDIESKCKKDGDGYVLS